MPPFLTPTICLSHLALTAYTLYLSYQNISRLQQYERTSEKAAQWSNTAADKLHKTRVTQASGVVSLLLSLTTCLYLLFFSSPHTSVQLIAAATINSTASFLAYKHMAAFWNEREQTRIPLVRDFNEAIRGSEHVVLMLASLSWAWGVAAGVWAVGLANGGLRVLGLAVWGLLVGGRVVRIAPQMGWKL